MKLLQNLFYLVSIGIVLTSYTPNQIAIHSVDEDPPKAVIYPNPAKDYVEVKSNNFSVRIKSIVVYNILGNEIIALDVNAHSIQLNVIKFKPGKYLVRVFFTDGGEEVLQLIKQ